MGQDDVKDRPDQTEGYQDQNEQDTRETRSDSPAPEPLTSDTGARSRGESSVEEDVDELDEDRDDDSREGGANRRRSIN